MAGQAGESPLDLKLDLLKNGREFSFFQAMRLLRLFGRESDHAGVEGEEKENTRVRPELSLAFPPSDIAKIEELREGKWDFLITATFLGLYGSSSPLPTFYTEDLLEEAAGDRSTTRDFLDILNHRLFSLFFRCWTKYRLFLQVVEEKNPGALERLFCFLGLGEKELRELLPDPHSLIRYTGLFTQFPRSAWGLETLLRDALGGNPVEVIPCIQRRVKIPLDQRSSLGVNGSSLGEDSFLGEEMDDRMGKFQVQIGPLPSEQFHSLLPGNVRHRKLAILTRLYLHDPLEYDLRLILKEGEAGTVCLGAPQWSRLGWDTWTFSGDHLGEVQQVTLPVENQE